MNNDDFEHNKEEFVLHVRDRIAARVRTKISSALLEILADHDTMVASSLMVDVRELIETTAKEEITALFKED